MDTKAGSTPSEQLAALSVALGREDRGMAILGEGNASVGTGGGRFLVKASGKRMATLTPSDLAECRSEPLMELVESDRAASDAETGAVLMECRVDPRGDKPSVEAFMHAYLLSLPEVRWVGHVHCTAVNSIMCSPHGERFAAQRLFPDQVVCCGARSVFVPYVDPGLALARAVRERVEAFCAGGGRPPRVLLLANHGVVAVGASADSVLGSLLMAQKAARIWLGAASLGGPCVMEAREVERIAGREDEHFRQRVLGLDFQGSGQQ